MNLNVFYSLSYGVYIVSAMDGERPTGFTANSVMQVTAEPSIVAISVNHNNFTHGCIERTGKFSVSILSEKTDPRIISTFGFRSGKDFDKFAGFPYEMQEGLPVLLDSCGYLICSVVNKIETETHTIFLGEVVAGEVIEGDKPPMTYAYYHRELKGKSPKNAPTYIPPTSASQEGTKA